MFNKGVRGLVFCTEMLFVSKYLYISRFKKCSPVCFLKFNSLSLNAVLCKCEMVFRLQREFFLECLRETGIMRSF
jgi:hypothetical protein